MPEKVASIINGRCGSDDEINNIQAIAKVNLAMSRESGKIVNDRFCFSYYYFLCVYQKKKNKAYLVFLFEINHKNK